MNKRILGISALVVAAALGGLGGIFGKLALRYYSPTTILFLRFFFAFLILFPILFRLKDYSIKKKDRSLVFLVSLLWVGNVFGFIFGLKNTTAIMSQLVYLLVPLIVLLLSKAINNEKFLKEQIIGVLLGLAGGFLLVSRSLTGNPEELLYTFGTFKGNATILLAVFSWSLYLFFSKKVTAKYSPLSLTTYSTLVTVAASLPFFVFEIYKQGYMQFPGMDGVVGILGLVFVNSIGMLFLYQWGTKNSSSFSAASLGFLSPLTAAVVAIPLFGERLTGTLGISGMLIFIGVYLATIYPIKRK